MDDQLPITGDAPVTEPISRRRREQAHETPIPSQPDPLGAAIMKWAGNYTPTDVAAALTDELAARGIGTLDQFLGMNPNTIRAALNAALRRDVVSLVNVIAQAKQEQE